MNRIYNSRIVFETFFWKWEKPPVLSELKPTLGVNHLKSKLSENERSILPRNFTNGNCFLQKFIGYWMFVFSKLFSCKEVPDCFRSNETIYDNSTFVHIPILQDGGYEQFLVAAILFFLVGIVCNAILVWAAMQVRVTSL